MVAHKKTEVKVRAESSVMQPVAIVGMAGILPEAENLTRYWENILDELNCIREVPASRWSIADYYDADPAKPDKTYCKVGGFIPDIQFDPMEFGLPPNFLEVTDVSQLLGLVVARDALADAGYPEKGKEILDRTGVILGMVGMSSKVIHPLLNRLQYPVWEKVLRSSSVAEEEIPAIIEKMKLAYVSWNENAFPGAIGNVVAGRIANRFDLGGTNCIVDAACGSSLAAVSMAISELALGRADMMITGGVDSDNSILTYLCFSKTPAFSKGDQLRAFSAGSDGMLAGEGIAMFVLKRLDDAEKVHDRIYAVIRGVGTSSDGYFKSIYAPRASGQSKALRRAYDNAGYPACTVGLIEAHGTGTNAGDPAEFEGLRDVFSEENPQKQHIALGSIKSQIGHTKATAGAASLMKASLALHHKVLPATINVTKPNPVLNIENTPFYLNTETRPWFKDPKGFPRRAGVSSFGFGGTNFHIAVEEYQGEATQFVRLQTTPFTVVLSSEAESGLLAICRDSLEKLNSPDAKNYLNQLDRGSYEHQIPASHARLGFLAESLEDAREKIAECLRLLESNSGQEAWSHPKGIFYRARAVETEGKMVALFPGQGAQYVNMGKELAINFSAFREVFENVDDLVSAAGRDALTKTIYPIPVFSDAERTAQQDCLTATQNAQPAIGAHSMALFRLLKAAGFKADFFAGHSFGELTALWACGVLDDNAFIRLAVARGEAMGIQADSGKDSGAMAAVKGDVRKVQEVIQAFPDVQIANYNAPTQVVLAGSTEGIQAVKPALEQAGLSVIPLRVSAAFHTAFVEHAKAPFAEAIRKETFAKPQNAVYSNSSANQYPDDPQKIAKALEDHILSPVKFADEIEGIYNAGGRVFIEVGPKNILGNLVKEILSGKPHEIISLNPNPKGDSDMQFRQAVLQMRVLGLSLGNVDPCRRYDESKASLASKVAVNLNGGLYMTEETRKKFEDAISVKSPTKPPLVSTSANVGTDAKQDIAAETGEPRLPEFSGGVNSKNGKPHIENEAVIMTNDQRDLESLVTRLQEHQSEFLKTHQQYLQNDGAAKTMLQELARMEMTLLSSQGGNGPQSADNQRIASLGKRAEFVAGQHAATSDAHQEYIKSQTSFTQQYAELVQTLLANGKSPRTAPVVDFESAQTPSPLSHTQTAESAIAETPAESSIIQTIQEIEEVTKTATRATPESVDDQELARSFLQIVSEKTGYPSEMLELSMDMEADLGIDSIKRVEILGAMQEQYPHLPPIDAEQLSTLRTLEQVIGAFKVDEQRPSPQEGAAAPDAPQPATQIEAKTAQQSVGQSDIEKAFLEIVSEKTGYPVEMLETSMDMEADLGIDSIKRVEILGAMQEKYPELPTINAEELVELRTLEQIIVKFGSDAPKKSAQDEVIPAEAIAESQPAAKVETLPVVVKMLPRPDQTEIDYPQDGMALVTDDATQRSVLLVKALKDKGLKVGMIHIGKNGKKGSTPASNGVSHYMLPSGDENSVQALMEEIVAENSKLVAFIHMEPSASVSGDQLLGLAEESAETLKTVFMMARHLKAPLSDVAKETRPAFITVTQMDGNFGLNDYASNDPMPGGFAGLAKSLRKEWNDIYCRAIDIHPAISPEAAVEKVMDELHDADLRIAEVGYTPAGRFTIALGAEA